MTIPGFLVTPRDRAVLRSGTRTNTKFRLKWHRVKSWGGGFSRATALAEPKHWKKAQACFDEMRPANGRIVSACLRHIHRERRTWSGQTDSFFP